jgi:hypothetical protein
MSYISFKPRARGAMLMVAADLRIFFDKARAAFLFVKVGLFRSRRGRTPDLIEGYNAFVEKRPLQFNRG